MELRVGLSLFRFLPMEPKTISRNRSPGIERVIYNSTVTMVKMESFGIVSLKIICCTEESPHNGEI